MARERMVTESGWNDVVYKHVIRDEVKGRDKEIIGQKWRSEIVHWTGDYFIGGCRPLYDSRRNRLQQKSDQFKPTDLRKQKEIAERRKKENAASDRDKLLFWSDALRCKSALHNHNVFSLKFHQDSIPSSVFHCCKPCSLYNLQVDRSLGMGSRSYNPGILGN